MESARNRREVRLLLALGGKFGLLLAALIVLMMFSPLVVEGTLANFLLALSASVVLVGGFYAVRPGPFSLRVGLFVAVIDLTIGRVASLTDNHTLLFL